jgi:hypothetical protein
MNKFICLLFVFFMVAFAHAQEIQAQELFAQEVDFTYAPVVLDSFVLKDSVAQIQSQYERNLKMGKRQRFIGTILYIAGGVSLSAGIAFTVLSVKMNHNQCGDFTCGDVGPYEYLISFSCVALGIGSLIPAYFIYSKGSKKLERAHYYEEQLNQYKQYSMSLKIVPFVNPLVKAFGGNLLLDF